MTKPGDRYNLKASKGRRLRKSICGSFVASNDAWDRNFPRNLAFSKKTTLFQARAAQIAAIQLRSENPSPLSKSKPLKI
jgi:hypothetical protein